MTEELPGSIASFQAVLADLLQSDETFAAWRDNPEGFARSRLSGRLALAITLLNAEHLYFASRLYRKKASRAATIPNPADNYSCPASPSEPIVPKAASPPFIGLSHRPELDHIIGTHPELVQIIEYIIDRFFINENSGVAALWLLSQQHELLLHSLDISIGSPHMDQRLDYLRRVKVLLRASRVSELSDHIAFTHVGTRKLPHFVPLWRTEEQLEIVVRNVRFLQEFLDVQITLENIACPFDVGGDMTSMEFASELAGRSGCKLLLDISNVLADEENGYCNAAAEFARIKPSDVQGIHLAGGQWSGCRSVDSHDQPIPQHHLHWLAKLLPKFTSCHSIIVERDGRFDKSSEILDDLTRIHTIAAEVKNGSV